MNQLKTVRNLERWALMVALVAMAACGSDDATAIDDDDADGIVNLSDNCPTLANAQQADQDSDDVGDVCDPSNDNPVTVVANVDMEGTDRGANTRTCDDTEVLSGITVGFSTGSSYIDTAFYRCTQRFPSFVTTEDFGEVAPERGPDLDCNTGEVVVGIAYKDLNGSTAPNDRMDAATLLCAPMAGPDTNPRVVPDTRFDANPGTAITVQCPEGSTAAGIVDIDSDTGSSNNDAIDGLSIECRAGRWNSLVAVTP